MSWTSFVATGAGTTYLLGRDRVRVYDGSWAAWGRAAGTPVERA
jgi:3-mercaptopyruvate sulfurtransferase SseA